MTVTNPRELEDVRSQLRLGDRVMGGFYIGTDSAGVLWVYYGDDPDECRLMLEAFLKREPSQRGRL